MPSHTSPAGEAFRLPDGRTCLELLEGVAAGLEGLGSVRRGDHDDDARLPWAHLADAVDHGQATHAGARFDLVGDLIEHGQGHGLEGLVAQADHGLSREARRLRFLAGRGRSRRIARLAHEDDHGTIGVGRGLAAQLVEQALVERAGLHLEPAIAWGQVGRATGDRRDDGQLIPLRERLVRTDVGAVPGEANAALRAGDHWQLRHQGLPGGAHVGALGKLEDVAPQPGLGALQGEQPDGDAHG